VIESIEVLKAFEAEYWVDVEVTVWALVGVIEVIELVEVIEVVELDCSGVVRGFKVGTEIEFIVELGIEGVGSNLKAAPATERLVDDWIPAYCLDDRWSTPRSVTSRRECLELDRDDDGSRVVRQRGPETFLRIRESEFEFVLMFVSGSSISFHPPRPPCPNSFLGPCTPSTISRSPYSFLPFEFSSSLIPTELHPSCILQRLVVSRDDRHYRI
jgi:hypothetical protein